MNTKIKATLESCNIPYQLHRHNDFSIDIRSPKDFAAAMEYDLERITKTIFLHSMENDKYLLAVCSANKKLDFDSITLVVKGKKICVASREKLNQVIGYPPTGVSPLGVPKEIPILVDCHLLSYPSILIGSGVVGMEIEINPIDLIAVTFAIPFNVTISNQ